MPQNRPIVNLEAYKLKKKQDEAAIYQRINNVLTRLDYDSVHLYGEQVQNGTYRGLVAWKINHTWRICHIRAKTKEQLVQFARGLQMTREMDRCPAIPDYWLEREIDL